MNSRTKRAAQEIKDLESRVLLECPPTPEGSWLPQPHKQQGPAEAAASATASSAGYLTRCQFKELPISENTRKGLLAAGFKTLTRIQQQSIPHALVPGRSVLGEAETGSGKTLAFVVPALEILYRNNWTREFGLGVLIISPTRELCTQIFQVLSKVGKFHDFSACCLIGGRNAEREKNVLPLSNFVVGTPGRILHHLDENAGWDVSHLLVLVIDEADQLVERGFLDATRAILEQLPPAKTRQNFFFSATLSSLEAEGLARLAVQGDSKTVARINARKRTNKDASGLTPTSLQQFYAEVPLDRQLSVLFALLRTNSQKKTVVFVNTIKQVRYIYEIFRHLKAGPAMFELHGKQSLEKRQDELLRFSRKAHAGCLVATDVAARGIDFPSVDWVVQLNCPADVDTYVHRVGRTARFERKGKSLLFLLPTEMRFLERLTEKKVACKKVKLAQKVEDITRRVAGLLAQYPEIRHLAQRALVSYLRSIAIASDREVFDLIKLINFKDPETVTPEAAAYAKSLGLPGCPSLTELGLQVQSQEGPLAQAVKRKSKLEILKEKIAAKKAAAAKAGAASRENVADDDDDDGWDEALKDAMDARGAGVSRRKKQEQRMKLLRDGRELPDGLEVKTKSTGTMGANLGLDEEEEDDEFFLQPSKLREDDDLSTGDIPAIGIDLKSPLVQRRLRKQQIRMRADGSAKIRGLSQLSKSKDAHIFFDDESGALETLTPQEAVVREINAQAEPAGGARAEQERREALRAELKTTEAADRKAERQLLRQRKKKRAQRASETNCEKRARLSSD